MDLPSLGSTFQNIPWHQVPKKIQKQFYNKKKFDPMPMLPVAVLLDQAGVKGLCVGGAMVSRKHPNFIVNRQSASSKDVRKLIMLVKKYVRKKFSVVLREEIQIIS